MLLSLEMPSLLETPPETAAAYLQAIRAAVVGQLHSLSG